LGGPRHAGSILFYIDDVVAVGLWFLDKPDVSLGNFNLAPLPQSRLRILW